MSCLLTNEELNQYLDGALRAAERERVETHLLTCRECGEKYDTLFQLVQNLRGLQALKAREDTADRVLNSIRAGSLILEPPSRRAVSNIRRFPGAVRFAAAACVLLAVAAFALRLQRDSRRAADTVTTVSVPAATARPAVDGRQFGEGSIEIDLTSTMKDPSTESTPPNSWSSDVTQGILESAEGVAAGESEDRNGRKAELQQKKAYRSDPADDMLSAARDGMNDEGFVQRDAKEAEERREGRALSEGGLQKQSEEQFRQNRQELRLAADGPERSIVCKVAAGKSGEVRERLLASLNTDAADRLESPRDEANAPAPQKASPGSPPAPAEEAAAAILDSLKSIESTEADQRENDDVLFAFLSDIEGVLDVSVRRPVAAGRGDDLAPGDAENQGGGGAYAGRLGGDAKKESQPARESLESPDKPRAVRDADADGEKETALARVPDNAEGEENKNPSEITDSASANSEPAAENAEGKSKGEDAEALGLPADKDVRLRDAERFKRIQSRVEILEVTETAIRILFDGREIEILLSE